MIDRKIRATIEKALLRQPAVALIGPRQVGKTTLALEIARSRPSIYLDLESYQDRERIKDPIFFFNQYEDHLIILDEIHKTPEIFQSLRGIIDKGRQQGKKVGRFLILGSASIDLLKQSGESLAGRIAYCEMNPLSITEVNDDQMSPLWIRGGFPESFDATSDQDSFLIRRDFVRTYLEREIQQFGPRVASETLERLWLMLANNQGGLLNASKLATNIAIAAKTLNSYIDLMADLFLIRRLQPYYVNLGKRLIKSPKLYLRDSGILHYLLGIQNYLQLAGHPIIGASFEGFVIENLISAAPIGTKASFYRTNAGAEIDLLLEFSNKKKWAIEIKSGLRAQPSKGYHFAIEDIKSDRNFIVYAGTDHFKLSEHIEVINLRKLVALVSAEGIIA